MNLTDHFLVSTQKYGDLWLSKAVIYVFKHDDEGVAGLVINHKLPAEMQEFFKHSDSLSLPEGWPGKLLFGGPDDGGRGFVLHTMRGSWRNSRTINDRITLTLSPDIIRYLPTGGRDTGKALFCLGCRNWSAEGLEKEIRSDMWLPVRADEEILFDLPSKFRYQAALEKMGIKEPVMLMEGSGNA